jgi:hypothetical protein
MSEIGTETSSTENSGVERVGTERGAHKGAFPTLEAAQQVKPPSDKFRVYRVTSPTGGEVFTWAWSVDGALTNAARSDGYTACVADPKGGGPVTKEKVAARLAEFTDEELAGMGLSRKKAKK